MKNTLFFSLLVLLLPIFLTTCSTKEEKSNNDDEFFQSVNLADSLELDSGEIRAYTLPTPLQVATALNSYNIEYSEEILLPLTSNPFNYSSNFSKALNLGINIIDMGYSAVYKKHQRSLKYFKNVEQLMDELGIISKDKQSMMKRFENNIDNQDSLYQIVLESYGNSHRYFKDNGREGLGLLILTGCFIEGLYISTSVELPNNEKTSNLIAQQKFFLKNIIELLSFYSRSQDVAVLISNLKLIQEKYNKVIIVSDTAQGPIAIQSEISKTTITEIRDVVTSIRNEIIK